jgi:hypothetical protein
MYVAAIAGVFVFRLQLAYDIIMYLLVSYFILHAGNFASASRLFTCTRFMRSHPKAPRTGPAKRLPVIIRITWKPERVYTTCILYIELRGRADYDRHPLQFARSRRRSRARGYKLLAANIS